MTGRASWPFVSWHKLESRRAEAFDFGEGLAAHPTSSGRCNHRKTATLTVYICGRSGDLLKAVGQ
jgi:hypothetical protein